jgi:predicted dehydrogenase
MALRFGLVGTGYWAEHAHAAGLRSCPDAELVALWGRNPAKATELAARLDVEAVTDFDSLVARVDAVAFAVPPDAQAALAARAARAGRHLLLDKPVALDPAAAGEVVDAVAAAQVASVVFFTHRFRPDVEEWTRQMAALAGGWHSARLVQYASIFQPGSPYLDSAWRKHWGALWDVGPHALAALLPVLGPVAAVTAAAGPAEGDTVHLILRHRSGAVSTASLSLTAPPEAVSNGLTFYGADGVHHRPEGHFEPSACLARAASELVAQAGAVPAGHRCDVRFGAEVVGILAAAGEALGRPGVAVSAHP